MIFIHQVFVWLDYLLDVISWTVAVQWSWRLWVRSWCTVLRAHPLEWETRVVFSGVIQWFIGFTEAALPRNLLCFSQRITECWTSQLKYNIGWSKNTIHRKNTGFCCIATDFVQRNFMLWDRERTHKVSVCTVLHYSFISKGPEPSPTLGDLCLLFPVSSTCSQPVLVSALECNNII